MKKLILLIPLLMIPMMIRDKNKHYKIAESLIGESQINGTSHNPIIVEMLQLFGFDDDDTNWCSAFVAYCIKKSGKKLPNYINASARSWLKYGTPTDEPQKGDIVVFWRESPTSWKGHVGFVEKIDKNKIYVLGGNQSGSVNIKAFSNSRLLGFRRV